MQCTLPTNSWQPIKPREKDKWSDQQSADVSKPQSNMMCATYCDMYWQWTRSRGLTPHGQRSNATDRYQIAQSLYNFTSTQIRLIDHIDFTTLDYVTKVCNHGILNNWPLFTLFTKVNILWIHTLLKWTISTYQKIPLCKGTYIVTPNRHFIVVWKN